MAGFDFKAVSKVVEHIGTSVPLIFSSACNPD
jgi:hypothetical protein